ncbi:MAG: YkgJ family cysteine cluster protein [Alphaproteobacteria bacterium]|nr:YkgJ family cysteine cluster protein [Alphaproteobacteria bacterium]
MADALDCTACGACCCNTDENRAEGYPWYVPIDDPRARLLTRPDLRKRYVAHDPDDVPHLRLDPSGRCVALTGRLGLRVACAIYADRPRACRRVQPGDGACLAARAERLGLR